MTAAGGALHTNCTGQELIVDDEGAVVGLRAQRGGSVVDFMGKAVVIATGGYGANNDMIKRYAKVPLLGRDPVLNNGEGAQMAWAAGAAQPWNLGILCVDTLYPIDADYVSYPGGVPGARQRHAGSGEGRRMHVNQLGKRFHSEDAFCWVPTYGGANGVAYDEPWLFVIADQAAIDGLRAGDETVDEAYLSSMEDLGVLFKGDTPEKLAEAAGWDPEDVCRGVLPATGSCARRARIRCSSRAPSTLFRTVTVRTTPCAWRPPRLAHAAI